MSQAALDRIGFNALRLSSYKDCLYYLRGNAGQRQKPTDVRVRHAVLCSEVGDLLLLTVLDPASPTVGVDERLDDRLVSAGFGRVDTLSSGAMIGLRSPPCSRRNGMRTVTVSPLAASRFSCGGFLGEGFRARSRFITVLGDQFAYDAVDAARAQPHVDTVRRYVDPLDEQSQDLDLLGGREHNVGI